MTLFEKKRFIGTTEAFVHLYTYRVKDRASGRLKKVQAKFWYAPWTIERMAKDVGLENH